MNGSGKPEGIKVLTALKLHKDSLLLMLNSKEVTMWISEVENKMEFTKAFSEGLHIRERTYNLIALRILITFDPRNAEHLREIEEANGLNDNAIKRARWIKPLERRRADQMHAYAIFSVATADCANLLIRDSMNIFGEKVRPKRQKNELVQCMKCRRWGHFATECQTKGEKCGTCGGAHHTNTCSVKGKLYCISCDDNSHASWDRNCPEFMRRCAIYNDCNPENGMPY